MLWRFIWKVFWNMCWNFIWHYHLAFYSSCTLTCMLSDFLSTILFGNRSFCILSYIYTHYTYIYMYVCIQSDSLSDTLSGILFGILSGIVFGSSAQLALAWWRQTKRWWQMEEPRIWIDNAIERTVIAVCNALESWWNFCPKFLAIYDFLCHIWGFFTG